jgi:DeoR family transcriptional regulator, suf operon transcriptional repressor
VAVPGRLYDGGVPETTALAGFPATRGAILRLLKRYGEARAEELAADLGMTASAVRQHLSGLVANDLVAHRSVKGGAGRPRHLFHLTPAAEALFPKAYPELTNELLAYVEEEDPALLARIFERRRDRRVDQAQARMEGRPFEERVAELARILDEDGYVAAWERLEDGSYRVSEHNCAVLAVAQRYGQTCSSEIEFIRAVLPEATVERVAHMMDGARRCAYLITPVGAGG